MMINQPEVKEKLAPGMVRLRWSDEENGDVVFKVVNSP